MSTDNNHRKAIAKDFLQLVVAGKIEDAYQKYVDMNGKHHNVFFPAGFPVLQQAMVESHQQFPTKQFMVKQVLGDGDLVAVHSHLILTPGGPEMAVVHILRFDGDRIIEMWDCGQILPEDIPNTDGAF